MFAWQWVDLIFFFKLIYTDLALGFINQLMSFYTLQVLKKLWINRSTLASLARGEELLKWLGKYVIEMSSFLSKQIQTRNRECAEVLNDLVEDARYSLYFICVVVVDLDVYLLHLLADVALSTDYIRDQWLQRVLSYRRLLGGLNHVLRVRNRHERWLAWLLRSAQNLRDLRSNLL